ncbi:MAG: hypothetical protein JWQ06_980 [Mucilaginibacter sp.]|nr:hypothetical protein [Mucilaginibacter sp.]
MKNLLKYSLGLFVAGALSLLFVVNADAQRGAFHGGGGGVRIGSSGGGGGFRGGVGFGGGFRGGYRGYGGYYGSGFGYYGYPHLGFYMGYLPYGYYPFYYGADPYFYADGIFYTPYNGGYQVTAPPVGAAVPKLPRGAKSIMIDNQQFYEFNGVYYKTVVNDKGESVYVVAGKDGVLNTDGADTQQDMAPKVGDVVDTLPDNCRKVSLNGKKYFVAPDDVYYEQIKDNNGNVAYRVASIPDDQPNNQQQQN